MTLEGLNPQSTGKPTQLSEKAHLQVFQTDGRIVREGKVEEWDTEHWERLQALREEEARALQVEIDRLTELARLQGQSLIPYLRNLQFDTKIGTEEWSPKHFEILRSLEGKNSGPPEAKRPRFNYLSKKDPLTSDEQKELRDLYKEFNPPKRH